MLVVYTNSVIRQGLSMEIVQTEKNSEKIVQPTSLNWIDNPSIQKLLDVVVSIIAEEYIQIAKQNPDLFSDNGGRK